MPSMPSVDAKYAKCVLRCIERKLAVLKERVVKEMS